MSASPSRVAVIGTGGTFAMEARHAYDWVEYSESGVVHPVGRLIDLAHTFDLPVEVESVEFRALGSVAITPVDWSALAHLVADICRRDDVDGIVITHGTATLEETAYFLDCVHASGKPVILTGAQRPSNTQGSDATANLRAALCVAAASEAREQGVLVVVNQQIFAARDVTKSSSLALDAFEDPNFGPLGRVGADGRVRLQRQVKRASGLPLPALGITLPRVDIALSYAGADGTAIEAFVAAGAQAIISAGLVPGRPATGEAKALAAAVNAGVTVVQSTRGVRGQVPPQAFLERAGVLAGGDLAPQKLRILLMIACAGQIENAQLQTLIHEA